MGTVVVDVMLKPEILDPQGHAVAGALPRLGFTQFTSVRQGKRFTLDVDGEVTPEVLAAAEEAARTLLSNPVMEDVVSVRDAAHDSARQGGYDWDDEDNPESWGAIGPIPAGSNPGRERGRRTPVDTDRLHGLGGAVHTGDDD
ncbi:Phosphoribosylformylglycinamidine synthase subunit PurS [Austwickia sp. TVS 96-490-7B]|nr:Phosphoribosylformylglycinamidine synthase subunit PurS [Austwickia sp. TVS 96-490-7B]